MMPPTPNPLSAPPTPLTRPRSSGEQILNPYQQYEQNKGMSNVDDLAAYLKDPTNILFPDDVSSVSFSIYHRSLIRFLLVFRHFSTILMLWLIRISDHKLPIKSSPLLIRIQPKIFF